MPGQALRGEDKALIKAFLRGDAAANRVIDGWIDSVLKSHLAPPRPYRDDVRQEVKVRLLQSLRTSRFRGNSSLRTFVHHIAVNVSVDFLRRRAGRARAGEPLWWKRVERDAESAYASAELVKLMLSRLPPGDRLLMWLVLGERYTYAEVARQLGKTEGAVRVKVHRCRRSLRERFGKE